jgi:putative oxidoreductase
MLKTHGALVGRMLIGLLFLFTGVNILLNGVGGTSGMIESKGLPMAMLLAWVVVAVKVVGGGALIAGYETKKAALALMGFTILTVVFFHLNVNDVNLFKNLSIVGGLMYVYVYGPGEGWKLG